MPVGAEFLMEKFNIPEGKQLGAKLKIELMIVENFLFEFLVIPQGKTI